MYQNLRNRFAQSMKPINDLMNNTKDLHWLSAPTFLLILGLIIVNPKKHSHSGVSPEKNRTETSIGSVAK